MQLIDLYFVIDKLTLISLEVRVVDCFSVLISSGNLGNFLLFLIYMTTFWFRFLVFRSSFTQSVVIIRYQFPLYGV